LSIFDQKQDVLDIELTSYGKYLLSKGQFKPEYYAFFDDDIIYDLDHAGMSESQNDTETRILEEIIYLRSNTSRKSKEKTVNTLNEHVVDSSLQKRWIDQENPLKNLPLGNSKPSLTGDNHAPAWAIKAINSRITDFNINGSLYDQTNHVKIPQIFLQDKKIEVKFNKDIETQNNISLNSVKLPDGTNIEVIDDYILLEIDEKNSEDLSENFEIEMYQMDSDSEWKIENAYKKMLFSVKQENIVDDMLMSPEEMPKQKEMADVSTEYVQHFFDILVDEEIDLYVSQQKAAGTSAGRLTGTYRTTIIGPADPVNEDC
jgi:hypothetical protein